MTKTFTHSNDLQEHVLPKGKYPLGASGLNPERLFADGPSADCIRNILNFSKNLDVRPSEHLGHLMYLKS
ncbi:MAG: hypothetical protein JNK73_00185 [Bacteroidia bacterium]|nr:hypothetical protein [Bacteroidia bacterium]